MREVAARSMVLVLGAALTACGGGTGGGTGGGGGAGGGSGAGGGAQTTGTGTLSGGATATVEGLVLMGGTTGASGTNIQFQFQSVLGSGSTGLRFTAPAGVTDAQVSVAIILKAVPAVATYTGASVNVCGGVLFNFSAGTIYELYQADAPCSGSGAKGSWTLTFTSVTPFAGATSGGVTSYTYRVSGTLAATLKGTTPSDPDVSLNVSF